MLGPFRLAARRAAFLAFETVGCPLVGQPRNVTDGRPRVDPP